MLGVAYLGLTTLVLHFQMTGYDPVHNVVSDYAVGPFAAEMASAFFVGGVGVISLSISVQITSTRGVSKAGSYLLLVAAIALLSLGAFPTDLEGASTTVHGTVHTVLSSLVFTLGPVGMTLISYGHSRRWFLLTLSGFVATSVFAVVMQLSLDATGLAERGLILLLLSWWFLVALRVFRKSLTLGSNRSSKLMDSS